MEHLTTFNSIVTLSEAEAEAIAKVLNNMPDIQMKWTAADTMTLPQISELLLGELSGDDAWQQVYDHFNYLIPFLEREALKKACEGIIVIESEDVLEELHKRFNTYFPPIDWNEAGLIYNTISELNKPRFDADTRRDLIDQLALEATRSWAESAGIPVFGKVTEANPYGLYDDGVQYFEQSKFDFERVFNKQTRTLTEEPEDRLAILNDILKKVQQHFEDYENAYDFNGEIIPQYDLIRLINTTLNPS